MSKANQKNKIKNHKKESNRNSATEEYNEKNGKYSIISVAYSIIQKKNSTNLKVAI